MNCKVGRIWFLIQLRSYCVVVLNSKHIGTTFQYSSIINQLKVNKAIKLYGRITVFTDSRKWYYKSE